MNVSRTDHICSQELMSWLPEAAEAADHMTDKRMSSWLTGPTGSDRHEDWGLGGRTSGGVSFVCSPFSLFCFPSPHAPSVIYMPKGSFSP